MNTSRLLARLGAKTSKLDEATSYETSGNQLTPSDVAYALKGCSAFTYAVMRVKYFDAGAVHVWNAYHSKIIKYAGKWAELDGARVPAHYPKGRLFKMVELAVADCLVSRVCRVCNGRIREWPANVTCKGCKRSGYVIIRERDRYRALGLSRREWKDRWSWRYAKICSDLLRADAELERRLRRNL